MSLKWDAPKDPKSKKDYAVDWSLYLESGELLTQVTWEAPSPLVLSGNTFQDGVAVVWISGGESGQKYNVICEITTDRGLIDRRTGYLGGEG